MARKTSGPTQPEDQRVRRQVLIRLSDEELDVVDEYARAIGETRSAAIYRAVRDALERWSSEK